MSWGRDMDALVGQRVINATIDKCDVLLEMSRGHARLESEGDCCSHTWVEAIENVQALNDAVIKGVKVVEMPDLGSPTEYEEIAYYGLAIETDKGTAVIDYRNSSNGYYGGWLNLQWHTAQNPTR